jgi:hypothetical protein
MGSCPLTVNLQGIVDASGSGDVVYDFQFSNGNASNLQTVTFQNSDSKVVSGVWEVHESLKDAWVRLHVAGPKEKLSKRSNPFSVTCMPTSVGGTPPQAPDTNPQRMGAPKPPAAQPPLKDANSPATPTIVKIPPHVVTSNDSVALDSVEPKQGSYLKTGQPLTFNISVSYNLVSADSAILSISTAELPTPAAGCSGGGELVDAVEVPIVRGKHQAMARLTWSGDTGHATGGRTYGKGYLSFSPMFWASNNGVRVRTQRLDYFGIYAEYCYQFGP